jgi:hypothetical protein
MIIIKINSKLMTRERERLLIILIINKQIKINKTKYKRISQNRKIKLVLIQ